MAMRQFTVAIIAAASIVASTVASSAGNVTPKQALAKGIPATAKPKSAQPVRHIIVKLRDGVTGAPVAGRASLREFESTTGVALTHVRELAGGASLVALRAAVPLAEAKTIAAALALQPGVEYAEPDVMFKRLAIPDDPRYGGYQWNLFEAGATFTGALLSGGGTKSAVATGGANLPPAWDVSGGGSSGVVVAVIDTGIVNHPDLNGVATPAPYVSAGRFVPGYDFVSPDVGGTLPPNFVANDGDGRDFDPTDPGDWVTTDDETQYSSFCDDGVPGPQNSSWHGTHMAGVVAATGNNGIGVAGIGWNVRVQPVRALGKCGGSLVDIQEAIRWAAGLPVPGIPVNQTPARVISLSLGGIETCSNEMQSAVDAAIAAGAVVVAATGNESNIDLISPANCRGVIAVTGHTIDGENADYANIGDATTISAPGGGSPFVRDGELSPPTADSNWTGFYVWSTLLFGATDPSSADAQGRTGAAYGGFTGTSVAAPHVAGVVALIKSLLPSASAEQVRSFLVNNARPFPDKSVCAAGQPFEGQCGAGLLDAGAALSRAVLSAAPVIVSGPQSVSIEEGQAATLAVAAAGAANLTYQWKRNGVDLPGATSPSYTTPALSVSDSGTRYSVSVTNPLGSVTSPEATVTVTPVGTGGPASPPISGSGGGGALPLGQLLLLAALLAGARLRRRE